eukprot:1416824-Pleurochrysis_carterae.AAC.1
MDMIKIDEIEMVSRCGDANQTFLAFAFERNFQLAHSRLTVMSAGLQTGIIPSKTASSWTFLCFLDSDVKVHGCSAGVSAKVWSAIERRESMYSNLTNPIRCDTNTSFLTLAFKQNYQSCPWSAHAPWQA